jgi:alpha-galactosidase
MTHVTTLHLLHGRQTSLAVEVDAAGVPLWRHWGARLPDYLDAGPPLVATRPIASFSLEQPAPFSLFPGFGMGWFAQSALLSHRQGQAFIFDPQDWRIESDGQQMTVHASDDVAGIAVVLRLQLDAQTDVLTISSTLINQGADDLDVQWLAAAVLPLPLSAHMVRHFSGRHNSEFIACEDVLGRGQWRRENRRGLTSHDSFPGAVVTTQGCTAESGLAFGVQLAWSGNHTQTIEWLDDGRFQWQIGEWLAPGEVRLAPGERLDAPDVLATSSPEGWNGVARNFHGAIRATMCWPGGTMAARPVHLNTWEGFYFDHDEQRLKALATAAANVGIERFVLDDGWFKGRDDDTTSLGDWTVDNRKYPNGLRPLADHVVAAGMQFGLWVEPEMINPDSDLFRAHPDWALQVAGRPLLTARNQLVLDLTRSEVGDYLFDAISILLRDLPIAYLKWDHNRDLTMAANAAGTAAYRQQVIAAYALFDRLRASWPAVEIEACAGGGGRIDAGIIRRTHRFWTSDCIDAVSRVSMQRGFLQFMPPEVMGSHIGAAPAHSTGRSQSMDFRAAVAMAGHFGVEFNLLCMGDDDKARLTEWVGFYKRWRHLLSGVVTTGTASDHLAWQANGVAGQWLLSIYRLAPSGLRYAPTLQLPFLERGRWHIRRIDPAVSSGRDAAWREGWTVDAGWLRDVGLPLPPMKAEEAAIILLERH